MVKEKNGLSIESVEARDLPDAWFQCVYHIIDKGYTYTIDRGSYEGQKRLEFDYVTVHIKFPGVRPLIPDIPAALGIPNPVAPGYVEEYLPYLMTPSKQPNEQYTYGERLSGWVWQEPLHYDGAMPVFPREETVDQIHEIIAMYKNGGFGTNQACMSVSLPSDVRLPDPPCLRLIDTRIRYGKLHFMVYFRSWDLWNGFPANLAAIQMLKEYMAQEIGVEDGEIIASSKGLHLYDYVWELAKLRTMKT